MIHGKKLFNELLTSLQDELQVRPELIKKYNLKSLDFDNIAFDEASKNKLVEVLRNLVEVYQEKKGEIKTRDINKLFS